VSVRGLGTLDTKNSLDLLPQFSVSSDALAGPPFINVKAAPYLAKGDGVAGAETAAITAAQAAGHNLAFPAGTYQLDSALSFASYQWKKWSGAGMERTIIKGPAAGNIVSIASGLNHGIVIEDMAFQGSATPTEYGFRATGATTAQIWFVRCQFKNLVFGFDTNATAVETTALRFIDCTFDQAPVRITGSGAHNAMKFIRCRFVSSDSDVPACDIQNSLSTDVSNYFEGCIFESNDRQALRAWAQQSLRLEECYFELNNTDSAASTPIVDLGGAGNQYTTFEDCYFNETGDTVIGSSNASPQMNSVVLLNNNITAGTVDRANMPDLFEVASGIVKFGLGDTDLFRSAANTLKTNDNFVVGLALTAEQGATAKGISADGAALQVSGIGGSRTWTFIPGGTGASLSPVGGLAIRDASGGAVRITIDTAGLVKILQALEIDGALDHDGTTVGFFGTAPATQRPANADTSGVTLAALETEVNELKQLLRDYGLLAT
jgi:hypothetical protein